MTDETPAILVVEDDAEVRELVAGMLEGAGFRVQTAATGLEAIALIEEKPFELLVADIKLPGGVDGLEMARHVRARFPALKCLFMSGKQEPTICDPALDDFVSKPFSRGELLGCVWKVLRGNRPYPRLEIAR